MYDRETLLVDIFAHTIDQVQAGQSIDDLITTGIVPPELVDLLVLITELPFATRLPASEIIQVSERIWDEIEAQMKGHSYFDDTTT